MLPHDGNSLSPLATVISAIVMGVGMGIIAIRAYFKERKEPKSGHEVVLASATFADRRTVERLVDALDRLDSAVNRLVESIHENTDETRKGRKSMDDCTEAVRASTDATHNASVFLAARTGG